MNLPHATEAIDAATAILRESNDQTPPLAAEIDRLRRDNALLRGELRECWHYKSLWDEAADERDRLRAENKELASALAGLFGLLQLFASRNDVPPEISNFATNHRALAAMSAFARYVASASPDEYDNTIEYRREEAELKARQFPKREE